VTVDRAGRHLVLVGLMGSGKSSVARRVGQRLGWRVVDLDAVVEATAQCSIPELFSRRGEQAFRDLETDALTTALADVEPSVLATGGGVVVRDLNRDLLRGAHHAFVVWLDASPTALAARVAGTASTRPLLADDPLGTLSRLAEQRTALYAEVAHHRIDTDAVQLDDVVDAVVALVDRKDEP
jgi:shikimate kinase